MGVLTKSLEVVRKGITFSPLSSGAAWSYYVGLSDERGYNSDVGDGSRSSLVEACVSWISNAVGQTHPAVLHYFPEDDHGEIDRRHPVAHLVQHPTFDARIGRSSYSWIPMMQATIAAFTVTGNAYWRKKRSDTGKVVQLWYIPPWSVTPHRRDFSDFFVDYYAIRTGASQVRVLPRDMVHFRDGLDPYNPLLGISKLRTLLREIYTDEEAARWTSTLLRRQATPGLILSPEVGSVNVMSEDEAKEVKQRLDNDFTGDNRGRSMVLGAPAKLQQYGFSPDQMKLGDLRDIPEERISAALGVPAAVVGFGSGLQTAKVGATMAELVDLAWQNGALPRTRLLAAEITEQLLPDFDDEPDLEFVFDTSDVPIMAAYRKMEAETLDVLMRWSIIRRGESRKRLKLPVGPRDDVYVLNSGLTEVDATQTIEEAPAVKPVTETAPAPLGVGGPQPTPALPSGKALTARESEVALLMASKTNKEIADALVISERTVETHAAKVMAKLGLHSREDLVVRGALS